MGRRPQYSRVPSRELHNILDEDVATENGRRGYAGGGMSLPRPYSASSSGNLQQGRMTQDSADRIAAIYGTLRGPMRRPHSTVGGTPGEYLGRDGGHCEQRQHNNSATHNGAHASQYSPSDSQQYANDNTDSLKQSVQEQLQQLVRELEEGDDSTSPGEWQERRRSGASRPLYSSNPALHLTCSAGLAGDHRSVSNADISTATNNSFSKSYLMPNQATLNNHNNRTMSASLMAPEDGTGRRAPLQASGEEWIRPGSSMVRGGDSSALDTLQRNHGRGALDLHSYQRGRSEDLRHALDSLSRMDSHKPRRISSMADGTTRTSKDKLDGRGSMENSVASQHNDVNAKSSSKTLPRRPPTTATTINSDKNNNSNSLGISKSSSGIPVKAITGSILKGICTNQIGTNTTTTTSPIKNNSNNNKNINNKDSNSNIPRSGSDFFHAPKVYRKSKSRELTPTIEAASEKINQLNSGTLKRISPFEAYRRTKSRELPLDHINTNNKELSPVAMLKSPPQLNPGRPTSPLEKTKTSSEMKTNITKLPAGDCEVDGMSGTSSPQLSANLSRSPSTSKSERPTNGSITAVKTSDRLDKTINQVQDKAQGREREAEKNEDKAKVKKTPSSDSDKPKSMYKMLTSRFNRSASFVSDNSRSSPARAGEDDEGGEKEDKFRLKRPSRFLKPRTEKSASKTSVCDAEDDADKPEKKPSKKLTDALNKFLGRKDPAKEEARSLGHAGSKATALGKPSPNNDQPKKPLRAKGKKSDEDQSTAQAEEDREGERAESVVSEATPGPSSTTTAAQPNYTLESATKSICNHLSQLENDITSRIGNMGTQEPRGGGAGRVRPGGNGSRRVTTAAAGTNISTYGLSPALANRRNGRPTNLDVAVGNIESSQQAAWAPSAPPPSQTPTTAKSVAMSHSITTENGEVRRTQEARSPSPLPTECPEEQRGQSEAEDESVMDRITRKSYYSKFQEKKRPKLRRANTREDMDQQLAAAKARLLKEERAEAAVGARRRLSSPRSPTPCDSHRPACRTSLPPEDAAVLMQLGGRRSSSLQPDNMFGQSPPVMLEDSSSHPRLPSLPPDDCYHYPRAPSVPQDDYLSHGVRMQSSPSDGLLVGQYSCRTSSVVPGDLSAWPAGEPYMQDTMMAAMSAGSFAGQVAADGALHRSDLESREPSVGRMLSPESTSVEESRSQAREELSRRLTHLTRLSGSSGLSGWSRGSHREGEQRPYRRTSTTGRLTGETTGPPVYRRTNTMDLPPADARARPGSEYRRHLQQDPMRRYSTTRTLVEGEPLNNPSHAPQSRLTSQSPPVNPTHLSHPIPYIPPSHMHSPSSTSSSSSHLTSPSSSSSSYRSSGPYSPSSSTLDSARFNSTLGRRTSFHRY